MSCSHPEPRYCTGECHGCMFSSEKKDCLTCANSFSDDFDRLHCALKDFEIVDDDYSCEEWN